MNIIGIARDQRSEVELARDWHGHVDAGRLGRGPSTTTQQLLRHIRNEEAVLGGARSVRFAVLCDDGRAGRL